MTTERERRALDIAFDIASSKPDWSLPEPEAVFSRETLVAACLAFAVEQGGMVLVPREPTEAMLAATMQIRSQPFIPAVWRAMIAAAPPATPTAKEDGHGRG